MILVDCEAEDGGPRDSKLADLRDPDLHFASRQDRQVGRCEIDRSAAALSLQGSPSALDRHPVKHDRRSERRVDSVQPGPAAPAASHPGAAQRTVWRNAGAKMDRAWRPHGFPDHGKLDHAPRGVGGALRSYAYPCAGMGAVQMQLRQACGVDDHEPVAWLVDAHRPLASSPAAQQPAKPEPIGTERQRISELDQFASDQRQVRAVDQRIVCAALEPVVAVGQFDIDGVEQVE